MELKPDKSTALRKVNMETYKLQPERYELRTGTEQGAPSCPYVNQYQWIGYDLIKEEYVRFTKSVFKKVIKDMEKT